MRASKIAVFFICCIICTSFLSALAHDNHDHYKEIESVLLGNNSARIMNDPSRKKLIRHLEYATSIALDQFNGFKKILLVDLQLYKVPELPAEITDTIENGGIDYRASGQTHRKYTHRGWTYEYEGTYKEANWPLRKKIMVNTVKKVLNSEDEDLCDSFAAVLYYIHILGDIQHDSSRTERDQVIPLIDRHGLSDLFRYNPNKDIFIELYHYLPILLNGRINKTYRSYYTRMMRDIKKLHSQAKEAMNMNNHDDIKENDNNLTQEQLDKYSNELLKVFSKNLPILLQHSVFAEILYNYQ